MGPPAAVAAKGCAEPSCIRVPTCTVLLPYCTSSVLHPAAAKDQQLIHLAPLRCCVTLYLSLPFIISCLCK